MSGKVAPSDTRAELEYWEHPGCPWLEKFHLSGSSESHLGAPYGYTEGPLSMQSPYGPCKPIHVGVALSVSPVAHSSLQTFLLASSRALSSPCPTSRGPEFLTARLCTWGDNADGHEKDVLLLMQVQLLQPHLELDERLNQLQGVPS